MASSPAFGESMIIESSFIAEVRVIFIALLVVACLVAITGDSPPISPWIGVARI